MPGSLVKSVSDGRNRRSVPLAAGVLAAVVCGSAFGQQMPEKGKPAPEVAKAGERVSEALEGTTLSIEMAAVPGGVLKKADEFDASKTVEVEIKPLWFASTELTWDVYDVFAFGLDQPETEGGSADATTRPSKPYLPADRGFGHAGYPAISITFNAAKEFCKWLSEKTGRKYRLATRDEWEYACLAGAEQGPEAAALGEFAWSKGNSPESTRPVAKKKANAWGLHDMLGNVGEWVVNADGKGRLAGGSYLTPAEELKAGLMEKQNAEWNKRDPQMPKSKWWLSDGPFAGFRIVCEPGVAESTAAGEQK
ncbi:MAG: formylglycine-generating enzyme family protein [Phycisphaerales bacterium]